ncbi:hypothetical protein EV363DRAFT_1231358, partial [Boletus edulis]
MQKRYDEAIDAFTRMLSLFEDSPNNSPTASLGASLRSERLSCQGSNVRFMFVGMCVGRRGDFVIGVVSLSLLRVHRWFVKDQHPSSPDIPSSGHKQCSRLAKSALPNA